VNEFHDKRVTVMILWQELSSQTMSSIEGGGRLTVQTSMWYDLKQIVKPSVHFAAQHQSSIGGNA